MPKVRMSLNPPRYHKTYAPGEVFEAGTVEAETLVKYKMATYVKEEETPISITPVVKEEVTEVEEFDDIKQDTEDEETSPGDKISDEDNAEELDEENPSYEDELNAMSKKVLKRMARERDIDVTGMKKNALIKALLEQ